MAPDFGASQETKRYLIEEHENKLTIERAIM